MPNWLTEFIYILSISTRTQWALVLGPIFYFGITLLGQYMLADFKLSESMAPLEGVITEQILRRYDKAAWFFLGSFWLLAIKLYKKDKKRLWA